MAGLAFVIEHMLEPVDYYYSFNTSFAMLSLLQMMFPLYYNTQVKEQSNWILILLSWLGVNAIAAVYVSLLAIVFPDRTGN